jgi:DNA-binding Lrp family transcriptional regulator
MVSAVVLVNTDMAEKNDVLERIKLVSGVEEAHALYGVYDFLVKINATSIDKLREIIKYSLTQLLGVIAILTLMVVEH